VVIIGPAVLLYPLTGIGDRSNLAVTSNDLARSFARLVPRKAKPFALVLIRVETGTV
jgi:hypothetical protein